MTKRQKIWLNYVVGPILFVWLSYSIYQQIRHQDGLKQSKDLLLASLHGVYLWKMILIGLLMFLNWGIEAMKWRYLVTEIQKVSFWQAYRAIFIGQALAFSTVNGIGESAGRALYLKEGNRLKGVALSLVGSMSQIIVTFVLGICSLIYLRLFILDATHQIEGLSVIWIDGLIYVLFTGIALFTLLYYRLTLVTVFFDRVKLLKKFKFFVEKVEVLQSKTLTRLIFFSCCRYFVFVVQYVLLSQVFGVGIDPLNLAVLISVMFLALSIMPTIAFAELGLRGQISLVLLGILSSNTLGIIATATGIWVINLIIPSIIGSLFILGVRLFRYNKSIK